MMSIKNYSVFHLAWPIFLQSLLSKCLGYADTIMLSRYSDTAVGAVGNADQIMGFLKLGFAIIASATGVVVSQYLGAGKDKAYMDRIYSITLGFNFVLSIVICTVVVFFRIPLLYAVSVPNVMIDDAQNYMLITGFFLFCDALLGVFFLIFNCNGKTSLGMIISLAVNIINILGNYIFLYGPLSFLNLGVTGVAISTSFGRIFALVLCFWGFRYIIGGNFSFKFLKPFPTELLARLLKLGLPSAGENIFYNISQLFIAAFVNMLGPEFVNAKIFCNILCGFSMIYSISVSSAASIITGHSVGAGDYDFAYKKVLKTLVGAMIVSVLLAGSNLFFAKYTLPLFTKNIVVIEIAKKIILIAFFLEIGRTVNLVVIQSMRAAGDVVFPSVLGICSMWGISVVFAWFFGIHLKMGIGGIWWAMAADEIFRALVVLVRWHVGSWRGKRITK